MDPTARQRESALRPPAPLRAAAAAEPIVVSLAAAIIAVRGEEPMVAVVPAAEAERGPAVSLPCGPYLPRQHGGIEAGVRFWARELTGIELGAVRQLCVLGDGDQQAPAGARAPAQAGVGVCYLALVDPERAEACEAEWRGWYTFFPWEDWRHGKPSCLADDIEPRLAAWARQSPAPCEARPDREAVPRGRRLRIAFGFEGATWDEEKVVERYQLLCEAGLLSVPALAHPLLGDQGRVLAAAIGEVRRSVKYQPAIFELMPQEFTLFELQKTTEAILGPHLHKQNFRRLVEGGGLVEPTGDYRFRTGGRPARLYRFRRDVLLERLAPGVRIKAGRS